MAHTPTVRQWADGPWWAARTLCVLGADGGCGRDLYLLLVFRWGAKKHICIRICYWGRPSGCSLPLLSVLASLLFLSVDPAISWSSLSELRHLLRCPWTETVSWSLLLCQESTSENYLTKLTPPRVPPSRWKLCALHEARTLRILSFADGKNGENVHADMLPPASRSVIQEGMGHVSWLVTL